MARRGALVLLLTTLFAAAAHAAPSDCDAAASARVLAAAADDRTDARAVWLDAATLQWPGKPRDGRYRLAWSMRARLQVTPDGRLVGADGTLVPVATDAPLPAAVAQAFAFVGDGVRLGLDAADRARVRDAVAAQWLLLQEDAQGHVLDATGLQWPGHLDAAFDASDAALGPDVDASAARLGLWAPSAQAVAACLYPDADGAATQVVPLRRDAATGTWRATLDGDRRGAYYTFLVDVVVPGVGLVRNRVTDPYAVSLAPDSTRAALLDLDDPALAPPGWRDHPRPAAPASNVDMALYELHVRDFSAGDAGVPSAHRGRYLAFTHAASAGMRHLRALREAGLTDVHLLPVFDFASVPERACITPRVVRGAPDSPAPQAAVAAAAAVVALSQGVAYWHAGIELLRSKSLDRNSFDSGDAFNRLDWTARGNGFGLGLPPAADNAADWPRLAPVLRDPSIPPTRREIAWTREVFRDWLRLRASTPLLRLRDADAVRRRLTFPASGPAQNPAVIVGHLDGRGLGGPRELLYLVNASARAQTVALPGEAGKRYVLHPVLRDGRDARVRAARFDARGRFTVPARTAVVYVLE